jgi:hypothetical protein
MTTPSSDNPKPPGRFERRAGQIVEVAVEVVGNKKTLPERLKGYKPFKGVPKPPAPDSASHPPGDDKPAT